VLILVPHPQPWSAIQVAVSNAKLGANWVRHQAHNHTDRQIFYNAWPILAYIQAGHHVAHAQN